MKSNKFFLLLLMLPFFAVSQSSSFTPEGLDARHHPNFVSFNKAAIQIQDSAVFYNFSTDWDSYNKNILVSLHWESGFPYERNYFAYDLASSTWNKTFATWTTYHDTSEIVKEYLERPYNSFLNNWSFDTSYYYVSTNYYSHQFYDYIYNGRIVYKSYDSQTNQFNGGGLVQYEMYNDTLYKSINYYGYNAASETYYPTSRYSYAYDENNFMQMELQQAWNSSTEVYENDSRHFYVFENGRQMQVVYQYWSGTAWVNADKDVYEYDSNGNQTLSMDYNWDDVNYKWVNNSRNTYTYTNNLITERINSDWNSGTSTWDNDFRYVYSYDANGNEITYRSDDWVAGSWVFLNKNTQTYNANNLVVNYLSQNWDNVGSAWINDSQSNYTYDANGNNTSYISQNWNSGTSTWVNSYRSEYTYDANNNRTQYKESSWNSGTSSWDYSYRGDYFWSVYETTNLSDLNKPRFTVFPNPSNGLIQVDFNDGHFDRILITDMSGKVVYNQKAFPGETINVRQFGSGLYTVQLFDAEGVVGSSKITVQ